MYPVSSFSSRMAQVSGLSSGSIKPAGTSMTVALTGGRHCFWRMIRGSSFGFWHGSNANTIDVRPSRPSEAFSRLPCALNTFGVSVGDSSDCQSTFDAEWVCFSSSSSSSASAFCASKLMRLSNDPRESEHVRGATLAKYLLHKRCPSGVFVVQGLSFDYLGVVGRFVFRGHDSGMIRSRPGCLTVSC